MLTLIVAAIDSIYKKQHKENFLIHGELTETNKALIFFSKLGSNLNFRRILLNRWC